LALLRDLQTIWRAREAKRGGRRVKQLRTRTLLTELCAMEESPWGSWYGREFEPRDLASLLKPYGIHSITIRNDEGKPAKGYKRDDLYDAWQRYLS
jgi:hypothetical protein